MPRHSPYPWYIGHISQPPEVPYCYYKLVTNIIRSVKIHVLSYPWYTVWYTTAVSIQGSNHPVHNQIQVLDESWYPYNRPTQRETGGAFGFTSGKRKTQIKDPEHLSQAEGHHPSWWECERRAVTSQPTTTSICSPSISPQSRETMGCVPNSTLLSVAHYFCPGPIGNRVPLGTHPLEQQQSKTDIIVTVHSFRDASILRHW
jgi:hypothetical protein